MTSTTVIRPHSGLNATFNPSGAINPTEAFSPHLVVLDWPPKPFFVHCNYPGCVLREGHKSWHEDKQGTFHTDDEEIHHGQ